VQVCLGSGSLTCRHLGGVIPNIALALKEFNLWLLSCFRVVLSQIEWHLQVLFSLNFPYAHTSNGL
jgi:hypothetical protein